MQLPLPSLLPATGMPARVAARAALRGSTTRGAHLRRPNLTCDAQPCISCVPAGVDGPGGGGLLLGTKEEQLDVLARCGVA